MDATDMLLPRLQILGPPLLCTGAVAHRVPERLGQLAAVLALEPGVSRGRLAELLWERASPTAARNNLRQLLFRCRTECPELYAALAGSADPPAINAARLVVDARELLDEGAGLGFQQRAELLAAALSPLLDGTRTDSASFDAWLAAARQRIDAAFLRHGQQLLEDMANGAGAIQPQFDRISARLLELSCDTPQQLLDVAAAMIAASRRGTLVRQIEALSRRGDLAELDADTVRALTRMLAIRPFAASTGAAEVAMARPVTRPRIALLCPDLLAPAGEAEIARNLIAEIADRLARLDTVVVMAPHSSLQLMHDGGHLRQDGPVALTVDYSVTSRIAASQNSRIMSLRLVNCLSTQIVWTDEVTIPKGGDYAAVQKIRIRLSRTIAGRIDDDVIARMGEGDVNGDAFAHLLLGRRDMEAAGLIGIRRARNHFRAALRLAPQFSHARLQLAQTLLAEWQLRIVAGDDLLAQAAALAHEALRDDELEGQAHWTAGSVALYQKNAAEARSRFRDAEALSPNHADMLVDHADALLHLDDLDGANARFDHALALNPLAPDSYWWKGAAIALARGDIAAAAQRCARIESEELGCAMRAATFALTGDLVAARRYLSTFRRNFPGIGIAELVSLLPDGLQSDLGQRYVQGLRIAGMR